MIMYRELLFICIGVIIVLLIIRLFNVGGFEIVFKFFVFFYVLFLFFSIWIFLNKFVINSIFFLYFGGR